MWNVWLFLVRTLKRQLQPKIRYTTSNFSRRFFSRHFVKARLGAADSECWTNSDEDKRPWRNECWSAVTVFSMTVPVELARTSHVEMRIRQVRRGGGKEMMQPKKLIFVIHFDENDDVLELRLLTAAAANS